MFMIHWLRNIFYRITGISTPLGGISWKPSDSRAGIVPKYHGPINLTSPENCDIIAFLEANDHKIVFLDTYIDASVSFEEQWKFAEREKLNLELIAAGQFSGKTLSLPNREGDLITATFYFNDDHVINSSAGGTGIITVDFCGFFEISRTGHSGPTTAFHLKEVKATLEARIDMLNQ